MDVTRSTLTAGLFAAALALTPAATADVAPGGWVDSRIVGSQLEMRDVTTGQVLIGRTNLGMLAGIPAGVTSDFALTPVTDGADIAITFRNTASEPRKLGRIYLGILNLGQDIEYFDFRHSSNLVRAHSDTHVGWAVMYPEDLYSPVAVLRNENIAVGMSIQYPVMDYKHDTRVEIGSPGGWLASGEAGRGWLVGFGLSNINQEAPHTRIQYEALLSGGEERVYTVSVRFSKNPGEWQHTLVPYRDYFRSMYGPVKYQRQTSPVVGFGVADPTNISAINPQGYGTYLRPDLNGFEEVVRVLRNDYDQWPAIMIWTPTGLYRINQELNYPFQFASKWHSTPQQRTAFGPEGFPSLAANGQTLGLWWGRSLGVCDVWDDATAERFNPANQEHRRLAFAELDAAAEAGATWVGLDTFAHHMTPIWDLRQWLRDMKARQPQMNFVSEPSMCDIMHVECPTFITAFNGLSVRPSSPDALFNIKNPDYLADFILPGHETWGYFRYTEYTRFYGAPSQTRIRDDMQRFADMGFRPCFAIQFGAPAQINAAASWETTVPESLRDADEWMTDIREGRMPGTDDPAPQGDGNPSPQPPPPSDDDGSADSGSTNPDLSFLRRNRSGSSSGQRGFIRVTSQPAGDTTPPPAPQSPPSVDQPPAPSPSPSGGGNAGNQGPRRMSSNFLWRPRYIRVIRPPTIAERMLQAQADDEDEND